MNVLPPEATNSLTPPAESLLLKALQKKAGLTVADLAAATGLSAATLHIALTGIRYRADGARVVVPTDITLVKVGSVLGLDPEALRAIGRDRAAELLKGAGNPEARPITLSEQEALAAAAARAALATRVLSAFSDDDLRSELRRREEAGR